MLETGKAEQQTEATEQTVAEKSKVATLVGLDNPAMALVGAASVKLRNSVQLRGHSVPKTRRWESMPNAGGRTGWR